ncbi:hypothetical protein ScPMuIL_004546 [Solemya velum]
MAEKTTLSVYTVDAFTDTAFGGNPAAVCPVVYDNGLSDDILQKIGTEMNLSETAFVRQLSTPGSFSEGSVFGLRWFTPVAEIKLCGHATLASAAILFNKLGNTSEELTFKTLSGDLKARREGDGIMMDFPTGLTEKRSLEDYSDLIQAFDTLPPVEEISYCSSLKYLLIRIKDGFTRSEFEKWLPSVDHLQKIQTPDPVLLIIVTATGNNSQGFVSSGGEKYDFVSRSFAPSLGVAEDPVTGSAHTVLAHYWSQVLNKQDFYVRQCSPRGGDVRVRLRGDRVELVGKSVILMEGTLKF